MSCAVHKGLKTPGRRQLRVAETVRHSLSRLLQCFPLQHAGRQTEVMITVTVVAMSPDLKQARVFVRCFHTQTVPPDWLQQLRVARRSLRGAVKLDLKFTPDLYFCEDETFAYADRIESLIAEDHHRSDNNLQSSS